MNSSKLIDRRGLVVKQYDSAKKTAAELYLESMQSATKESQEAYRLAANRVIELKQELKTIDTILNDHWNKDYD